MGRPIACHMAFCLMLTHTIILLLFTQKLIDLNNEDVDAPWFYMVAETRVAAENH